MLAGLPRLAPSGEPQPEDVPVQAEACRDPREKAFAFRLTVSRGEERSARAKLDLLRKRRPDWTAGER